MMQRSSMFEAGYEAGYRDALAAVRRLASARKRRPKPAMPPCTHSTAQKGIWYCPVCGESGGDIASCDTHPEDGDSTEIEAPLVSGAVGATSAETPKV